MKKGVNWFCSLIVVSVLFGCVSVPDPSEKTTQIIIGMIIQNGKNYPDHGGVSVNGKNKSGIIITIQNMSTNDKYKLSTNSNGFYYSVQIPAGKYQIKSLYLKKESGGYSADILMNPGNDKIFEITKQGVCNLGLIEWNCDAEEGMTYWLNKKYTDVQDYFANLYKNSKWINKEWININITK